MNINIKIRDYIKKHGLTFTYVSVETGISIKKISRIMTSKQKLTTEEYEKICLALDVKPGYFFEN